ncbi:MAG: hypothetical protein ACPGO3_08420 [Magnetospiraceae bacterium]
MPRKKHRFAGKFFLKALIFTLGIAVSSHAALAACPTVPPPKIDIDLDLRAVKYHHNLSKQQIRGVARDVKLEKNQQIAGFYRPTITSKYSLGYDTHSPGNCVTVSNFLVSILVSREVFIARDYWRGSCQYDVTVAHENLHVKFDQDLMQKLATTLKERLALRLKRNAFRDVKSVQGTLEGEMNKAFEEFYRKRDRAHASIDNNKNYTRESKLCR